MADLAIYFAGDSGYFPGFAEIGRQHARIDAALLPIGAYAPRWFMRYQHMDPEEAWQAARDLRSRLLVPMHWGTFVLTDEPLDEPAARIDAVAATTSPPPHLRRLAVGADLLLPTEAI